MPKVSDQQQFLTTVQYMCMYAFIDDDNETFEELSELFSIAVSHCFLSPRHSIPQSHDFLLNFLFSQPPNLFCQHVRTTYSGFNSLVDLLKNHPIFQYNCYNQQKAVAYQLAVTLMRLGCYGNAASLISMQRIFGIGHGTVVLFTHRVIYALCTLQSEWVVWPSMERQNKLLHVMAVEGFPGCVGFIDGTLLPLNQKPSINGASYYNSKKHYSLLLQVVCDADCRITAFHFGWPGSAHDASVYKDSNLYKQPQKYYSKGQYIIADSAYPLSKTCIPCYRQPAAILPDNVEFNYCMAHERVRNEHSIGILKGRWSSLREIRNSLNCRQDLIKIGQWVTACIVLHNMLAFLGDSWDEMFLEDNEGYEDPVPVGTVTQQLVNCCEDLKQVTLQINHKLSFLPIPSSCSTANH